MSGSLAYADAIAGARFRRLLVVFLGTLEHAPEPYSEARLAARITLREVETQMQPMLVTGLAVDTRYGSRTATGASRR